MCSTRSSLVFIRFLPLFQVKYVIYKSGDWQKAESP